MRARALLSLRHWFAVAATVPAYLAVHLWAAPRWGGFWRDQASDVLAGFVLPAVIAIVVHRDGWLGQWVRSVGGRVLLTLAAAAVWEMLVPVVKPASVGDPWDVAAYLAGTLGYVAVAWAWRRVR